MIRFYTWAKSVENPLPSQRNPDVELGTKRLEHAGSGQVTDEKDVRN